MGKYGYRDEYHPDNLSFDIDDISDYDRDVPSLVDGFRSITGIRLGGPTRYEYAKWQRRQARKAQMPNVDLKKLRR